jgi:hypothetical protein
MSYPVTFSYRQFRLKRLQLLVLQWMMCTSFSFPSSRLQLGAYGWQNEVRRSKYYARKKNSSPVVLDIQLYAREKDEFYSYHSNSGTIQHILRKNGFGQRLLALDNLSEQPLPCELYENKIWKLCLITGCIPANDTNKPPLLELAVLNDGIWEAKVVDIGKWNGDE